MNGTLDNTLGKFSALWSHGTCPISVEVVKVVCGKLFPAPVCTMWNLVYDSVSAILKLRDKIQGPEPMSEATKIYN